MHVSDSTVGGLLPPSHDMQCAFYLHLGGSYVHISGMCL